MSSAPASADSHPTPESESGLQHGASRAVYHLATRTKHQRESYALTGALRELRPTALSSAGSTTRAEVLPNAAATC